MAFRKKFPNSIRVVKAYASINRRTIWVDKKQAVPPNEARLSGYFLRFPIDKFQIDRGFALCFNSRAGTSLASVIPLPDGFKPGFDDFADSVENLHQPVFSFAGAGIKRVETTENNDQIVVAGSWSRHISGPPVFANCSEIFRLSCRLRWYLRWTINKRRL